MNSKTTGIWFVIAATLGVFIFVFQHYFHFIPAAPTAVLPSLQPAKVTSVQIFSANQPEIEADRTNGIWLLTQPLTYPGQAAAIEALLESLQKLMPEPKITASEMSAHKNADVEFGLARPQTTLAIDAGDQRWQLDVGNRTAPGNQVYLRVVGVDGAFVVDADWLKWIPQSADEWRDTSLVNATQNDYDHILLTNNISSAANQPSVIELRRDPTNQLWRMVRPLQARADSEHIADSLRRLQTARVTQFVTDNPKADLTQYGLQPADVDLWLSNGTNFPTALHFGKSPSDDSTQTYAKREGWPSIFKTAKDASQPWRGAVNDFRDSHLLELTAPVAEIEERFANTNDNFTLRRRGSNDWNIVGEKFPADPDNVQEFIKGLADLRIAEFAKDFPLPPELPAYGLDKPQRQIILRSAVGDTNVIAQLNFGTNQDGNIFVKRSDEDFIYAVTLLDFHHLPEAAWQLRDRRIWNFNMNDVAQITLRQNGKTRQIIRNGPDKWSLASGSQGVFVGHYIEQSVQRLSDLTAAAWVGHNENPPDWGFNPDNLQITIELKDGEKLTAEFGLEIRQLQTALAAVTLDGERWTFEFPPIPYQFVSTYLTIPANVP